MAGLFDDIEEDAVKRKDIRLTSLPMIPDTGWTAPKEPPNLSSAMILGVDTETYDPNLTTHGPGWGRHQGHIVGVSIAAEDRRGNRGKWYFPLRHEVEPQDNINPDAFFPWLKTQMATPAIPKVGANWLYDYGWLAEEGIEVQGELHDVQFGEALIDNNAFVALDILARKYLGVGKSSSILEAWIMKAYPKANKTNWRKYIYAAPPRLVGLYGEDDADLPLQILRKQWPILEKEQLLPLYRIENDLIPMLVAMRQQGIQVDVPKAEALKDELEKEVIQHYAQIKHDFGYNLVNTKGDESSDSRQIGKLLDHLGVKYPRTKPTKTQANGSPSITKEWLEVLDHPVAELLLEIREKEKICGTFLGSYIIEKNLAGKIYCQFHPLKGESNGTLVGRFSSSDPNLQNIPSRTDLGKRVRQCFIPDYGHYEWRKHDYSQVHYRILAHNAVDDPNGPYGGAEALRRSYIDNPDMDYHMKVYGEVAPLMGWSLTDEAVIKVKRRPIKNVNFSLLYGVGKDTMVYKYLKGMSKQEVDAFFDAFYTGAPYIKPTMAAIAEEAGKFGFVTTLLGRRIRFDLYEPRGHQYPKPPALPFEQAIKAYGSFIQLAFLYRAVNYKFQGSEPDIMKKGMLDCWNSGVFNYVGVPRLTVHDELDWSVRDNSPQTREAFAYIKHTMEHSVKLRVPLKVDATTGPNWGKSD